MKKIKSFKWKLGNWFAGTKDGLYKYVDGKWVKV